MGTKDRILKQSVNKLCYEIIHLIPVIEVLVNRGKS